MASEQNALRLDIAEKREEIAEDVATLRGRVRQRYQTITDWRQVLGGHPFMVAVVGIVIGLLLGTIAGRAEGDGEEL